MLTPRTLLERLAPLSSVEGYSAVKALLETPGAYLCGNSAGHGVTAGSALDIWSYRFERAQKGKIDPILGLEHLVATLSNLHRETILKLFLIQNDDLICVFWFDDQINTPFGFVVYGAGDGEGAEPVLT